MQTFFTYFAARSRLAYIISFLFLLLGAGTLLSIKRDTFPDVDFGEVLITAQYAGASPEDMELQVTNKLEKEIREVSGIKEYRSWSAENAATVLVEIDPDEADQDKVVSDIREAVARVTDLPDEMSEAPLVTELATDIFPVAEISLSGDIPYRALRDVAKDLQKKMERLTGVSKVENFGLRDREIRIEVSPSSLKAWEVSLEEISSAVRNRNVRSSGGNLESFTSEKNIVTLAQFRDPMDVEDVIVKSTFDGPLITLKDIATVTDEFEEERVLSRVNGVSAISLVIYKSDSADIIRTADRIKTLISEQQEALGDRVQISLSVDESTYVRDRFSIVLANGLIGLVLVLIVLTLFLDFRVAFWVAMGIPITILGTTFLLPLFDSFLDTVSMTAMILVIGIIVDDAIIISESIYQQAERGYSPLDSAVKGLTDVFQPVLSTILTTLVVFTPLFFMPGVLGKFVFVIPLVISLALIVSLLESTLALPAHLADGLKGIKFDKVQKKTIRFDRAKNWYRNRLKAFLRFRYFVVLAFGLIFAGSVVYAVKFLDFILFPSSTADQFVIFIETPTGSPLQVTVDRVAKVEQAVSALSAEELHSYITRIGSFGGIGASEQENHAAITVALTPFGQRSRTADEVIDDLREDVKQIEGLKSANFEIQAGGPPVGRPIVLRVVGSDDLMRKELAGKVMAFVQSLPGTEDVDRDDKPGKQQLEIKLDYEMLARIGISVSDEAQNVRIAYDGQVVTQVRYGEEDVDFRLIFAADVRRTPEDLKELLLPNRAGLLTPLGLVAEFVEAPGTETIKHYKGERTTTITGDVDQLVTTPLEVVSAVSEHFDLVKDYPGTQIIVGGEAEESEASQRQFTVVLIIAVIGVYLILVLLFNSFWHPFVVLLAMPFGLIGVIFAFAVHDQALGFLAVTGIIGLAGVVVNDSLVLVNHIRKLENQSASEPLSNIVATGTSDRLRAVVLTTLSTVAGLLPLAYGIGGSDPYMSPMALAFGWGLLFATPLTLLLIPCVYLIGADTKIALGKAFRILKIKKIPS